MKKVFGWIAVAIFVAGVPLSHLVFADPPKTKVSLCHIEGNGSGHVIEVAAAAVPAHLAHGDCLAAAAKVSIDGSCTCPKLP